MAVRSALHDHVLVGHAVRHDLAGDVARTVLAQVLRALQLRLGQGLRCQRCQPPYVVGGDGQPLADPLTELEAFVCERARLAREDKAAFERDGQRLNGQLMQGEMNMAAAVLGWIERRRSGVPVDAVDEDADAPPEES